MTESHRTPRVSPDGSREMPALDATDLLFGGATYRYLAVSQREPQLPSSLTMTEREVAHLAALGMSTAQIASLRRASRRTVENQLARVFRKLKIASRGELCALAFWNCDVP
jgi:DNA-binding CsgD family transcriptional regulator